MYHKWRDIIGILCKSTNGKSKRTNSWQKVPSSNSLYSGISSWCSETYNEGAPLLASSLFFFPTMPSPSRFVINLLQDKGTASSRCAWQTIGLYLFLGRIIIHLEWYWDVLCFAGALKVSSNKWTSQVTFGAFHAVTWVQSGGWSA